MKFSKKIIFTSYLVIFSLFQINLNADIPYFIDFKYILNESDAGKKAQSYLKNKLTKGVESIKNKENQFKM